MKNKLFKMLALFAMASMILAACGEAHQLRPLKKPRS